VQVRAGVIHNHDMAEMVNLTQHLPVHRPERTRGQFTAVEEIQEESVVVLPGHRAAAAVVDFIRLAVGAALPRHPAAGTVVARAAVDRKSLLNSQ